MAFFSCNVLNANPPKCVSINNQECKIKTKMKYINNNEPLFYRYSIEVNKCSDSCNNNNDPISKLCVPDVVKNINVKVFNLMSRTNEPRHIEWYVNVNGTCKCKCRLNASICNNKQCLNNGNVDVNVTN